MAKKKISSSKEMGSIPDLLAHFLADTLVVYFKTLNFHWNMVAPQFFMYHKLLEEQYKELQGAADDIAERIRMLRKKAPGSMKEMLTLASLKESPSSLKGDQMVKELVHAHEEMVKKSHALIQYAEAQKDQGTSDMMIERLRFHDKQAWLLRSHFSA